MGAKIASLSALVALSAALLGTPALAGKKNDTLNIAWDQPLDIADAYFNTRRERILAGRNDLDQLIERDPRPFQLQGKPGKGVGLVGRFHAGFHSRPRRNIPQRQPFDADDVVYTFNFASDPANKSLQL